YLGPPARHVRPRLLVSSAPGDERRRHPFPTRRSSDLWWTRVGNEFPLSHRSPAHVTEIGLRWRHVSGRATGRADAREACRQDPRSEEHTSELQSQSNLVCRLLLEKKKSEHRASIPPLA